MVAKNKGKKREREREKLEGKWEGGGKKRDGKQEEIEGGKLVSFEEEGRDHWSPMSEGWRCSSFCDRVEFWPHFLGLSKRQNSHGSFQYQC